MKLKKCAHGSKTQWFEWKPVPGYIMYYLKCVRTGCKHMDENCLSEYREKKADAIVDWNRKIKQKGGET